MERTGAGKMSEVFIARQPIFDRRQNVYAYELLFRSSLDNYFSHPSRDVASSKVIADSFLLFDLATLTSGKKAFINVTGDVLQKEYAFYLPRKLAVIEILETVEPEEPVLAACRKLKEAGYPLALDDFVYAEKYRPLVELADIIKVDVIESSIEASLPMIEEFSPRGIRFLAEKVETRDVFDRAMEAGYTFFQGYFFSKPVILTKRDIPAQKIHYLQILQEIHKRDMDFSRLEATIKRDVSLTYKLLRYINSPFFGMVSTIDSIQQVLLILGEKEIRKWVTLVALASMAEDKPVELLTSAVIRARCCEALAARTGQPQEGENLFLLGLFSLIDAIMDRPLADLLTEMPISDEVKEALLGGKNRLREVFNLVTGYELGDWKKFGDATAALGFNEEEFPEIYLSAVSWAQESMKSGSLSA